MDCAMSSGGCGVTTSAIELQDGKRYHYNVFFRAVFEARNVISTGAMQASDASQLWFVVGLRSLSSEESQLLAHVVNNGGGQAEFLEIKNVLFFSRCSSFAHAALRGLRPPNPRFHVFFLVVKRATQQLGCDAFSCS